MPPTNQTPPSQQPLSQPAPGQSTQPESAPGSNVGNFKPAPVPPLQSEPSSMPPRKGRKFLFFLLLVFMAGTGGFGYLWWKNRSDTPVATSPSPTATVSTTKQTTTNSYAFSIGPKVANLSLSLTADPSFRIQTSDPLSGYAPIPYTNGSVLPIFTTNVADGVAGDKASGRNLGRLYVVDLKDWLLKADDPTTPNQSLGGLVSVADKTAALTKLQELIDKKETKIDPYIAKGVLVPFSTGAANLNWRTPELLDIGGGFKGYSTIGMQMQNEGYNPQSFVVLLGKVKGASDEDHTILVFGQLELHDEFSTELDKSYQSVAGQTVDQGKKITSTNDDIKKNDKYPTDTESLQTKLVEVYKSIKIEATSK